MVSMICFRSAHSETSALFRAMRSGARFAVGPKPRRRGWVSESEAFEPKVSSKRLALPVLLPLPRLRS